MEPLSTGEAGAGSAAACGCDTTRPPITARPASTQAWLGWCAAASLVLYGLLALRYPLAPSLANPRASWVSLAAPTWPNLTYHLALYAGLTVLYILALRRLTVAPPPGPKAGTQWARCRLLIIGGWLACSAVLLSVAPGGESHDIFDYTFRGRMMAELGANPLADIPKDHRQAPYFRYVAWHSHVDTYGPVWEMTSAGVATTVRVVLQMLGMWDATPASCPQSSLACQRLIAYLTGYRLLAIGLTGVSAWLIASMVRRTRPDLVAAALAAWLWSPMVLIATAVGGHNDALMIVLWLAALWLMQRRRWLLGLLALVLAAHVKLTALVLTPVLGLWLVRRCGWRRALGIGLVAATVGLILSWWLYMPFDGWGTLPRMLRERTLFLANSPWRVLHDVLYQQRAWPYPLVWRLTVQLPFWLFGAGAVLITLWMLDFRPRRRQRSPAPDSDDDRLLWRTVAVVILFYLLVGSFWFQHWYILWVLAPAALLPDSRLTLWVLPWLGVGALSANVAANFVPAIMPRTARTALSAWLVAVIWAPALLAGGMMAVRASWVRRLAVAPDPVFSQPEFLLDRATATRPGAAAASDRAEP